MNYAIIQLKHTSKKSAHCSVVRHHDDDQAEAYSTKVLANKKINKLKLINPKTTYIVAKHWG